MRVYLYHCAISAESVKECISTRYPDTNILVGRSRYSLEQWVIALGMKLVEHRNFNAGGDLSLTASVGEHQGIGPYDEM